MLFKPVIVVLLATSALAAVGDHCNHSKGVGVCTYKGDCLSYSGATYVHGACPNDPNNVKCCYKSGCHFVSDFAQRCRPPFAHWVAGQCPGPKGYMKCVAGE